MTTERRFVRFAPCRSHPDGRVPVRVTDMTAEDAWWWDTGVQTHHFTKTNRADRYWTWPCCCRRVISSSSRSADFADPRSLGTGRQSALRARAMAMLIETYPHLDVREA